MSKTKNLILFFLITTSCFDNKNSKIVTEKTYDFEVLYLYQGNERIIDDKYRHKVSNDSLYIIIETGFKESHIILEENGETVFDKIVSTELSQGVADRTIRDIKNVKNIGVRIDSGPLIFLEIINIDNNIIGINKNYDKIQVVFYKKVPIYE